MVLLPLAPLLLPAGPLPLPPAFISALGPLGGLKRAEARAGFEGPDGREVRSAAGAAGADGGPRGNPGRGPKPLGLGGSANRLGPATFVLIGELAFFTGDVIAGLPDDCDSELGPESDQRPAGRNDVVEERPFHPESTAC